MTEIDDLFGDLPELPPPSNRCNAEDDAPDVSALKQNSLRNALMEAEEFIEFLSSEETDPKKIRGFIDATNLRTKAVAAAAVHIAANKIHTNLLIGGRTTSDVEIIKALAPLAGMNVKDEKPQTGTGFSVNIIMGDAPIREIKVIDAEDTASGALPIQALTDESQK